MGRSIVAAALTVTALMMVFSNCDALDQSAKSSEDEDAGDNPNDDAGDTEGTESADDELVPNPSVTRKRTFYKLYKSSESTCYFIPRPETDVTAMTACAEASPLGQKFQQYGVCDENVDPELINNIPCDVALELSTAMNNGIEFDAERPFPSVEDRVLACDLDACAANETVASYCAYYKDQAAKEAAGEPIPAIARLDSAEERAQAAICLNELYGAP